MAKVAKEYNEQAKEFEHIVQEIPPVLQEVEERPVLAFIGKLENKAVLDLACGDGRYTRILKKEGAQTVVGIDVADTLLAIGKKREETEKLGITYHVQDVANLTSVPSGPFDLCVAVYLLHYAENQVVLSSMANGIFENLKDGGRFVGLVANSIGLQDDPDGVSKWGSVGVAISPAPGSKDGDPMGLNIFGMNFTIYYWLPQTYVETFKKAGFENVKIVPNTAANIRNNGGGKWLDKISQTPWYMVIEAFKPVSSQRQSRL